MALKNRMNRIYSRIALGLVLAANVACVAPEQVVSKSPNPPVSEAPLMSWADLTSRPLPQPNQTVRYGDLEQQIVDLWLPEGYGPFPVVLMVHGGCWQKSIADRTLMNYIAGDLRGRGIAVWNIEYRGVDEEGGGYPGTFEDVSAAADALAQFGHVYNLSTEQIVVFGHSAGGHLGAWLASRGNLPEMSPMLTDRSASIKGVLNSGGLADLELSAPVTLPDCLASISDVLTGMPSTERTNVYSDTSPARLQPVTANQVSVNGARDRIAPPKLGIAYSDLVVGTGGTASFQEVPGGHVELIAPDTDAWDQQVTVLKSLFGEAVLTRRNLKSALNKPENITDWRTMPGPLPLIDEVELTDDALTAAYSSKLGAAIAAEYEKSPTEVTGFDYVRLSRAKPDELIVRAQYEQLREGKRLKTRIVRIERGDQVVWATSYAANLPKPGAFETRD